MDILMEIIVPAILLLLGGFLLGAGHGSKRAYIKGYMAAILRARQEVQSFMSFLDSNDRLHYKQKMREFEAEFKASLTKKSNVTPINKYNSKDKKD